MAGWVPFDADAWPEIACVLPKPWPEAARAFDLRWHADQNRGAVKHGRGYWAERWGCTRYAVRRLLKSEEWKDPKARQHVASGSPGNRQPVASGSPADTRSDADRSAKIASGSPEVRQPVASESPHARRGHTHTTHSQEEQAVQQAAPAGQGRQWSNPPTSMVREVFAAYRAHHPRKPANPTSAEQGKIGSRLRDIVKQHKPPGERHAEHWWRQATDELVGLVEWYHTAPDASHWQGDNDRGKAYLGLDTLMKPAKFGDRMSDYRRWHDAGRPTESSSPRDLEAEALKGWAVVLEAAQRNRRPERWSEDEAKHAAVRAALGVVSLRDIGQSNQFTTKDRRERWCAAYVAARSEQ